MWCVICKNECHYLHRQVSTTGSTSRKKKQQRERARWSGTPLNSTIYILSRGALIGYPDLRPLKRATQSSPPKQEGQGTLTPIRVALDTGGTRTGTANINSNLE